MISRAGWEWRITLDPAVDRLCRFGPSEPETGVIWFEPALPAGQALWLAERLNRVCNGVKVNEQKIWRELMKSLRDLGTRPANVAMRRLTAGEMVSRLGTLNQSSRAEAMPSPDQLNRFGRMVHGSSLLPEETIRLLEAGGFPEVQSAWPRYVQAALVQGNIRLAGGMIRTVKYRGWKRVIEYRCRRCGSGQAHIHVTDCPLCGGPCPYCEACLTMGRVRGCSILIEGAEQPIESADDSLRMSRIWSMAGIEIGEPPELEKWGLSPAQEEASKQGVLFLRRTWGGHKRSDKPPRFLVWAVTGAGKTEMIFPLIEDELNRGGRVLVATPRRDVVLELAPRIGKAFPDTSMAVLYGGSPDRWKRGAITLATTHQLLRIRHAFDLVIVDELDAFPYHNNPMLEYAALQACRPTGRFVLLSATPPKRMQREAAIGRLPHVKVPVRYHRHPLPVPERLACPDPETMIRKGRLPRNVAGFVQRSLARGAQCFVFVPKIALLEPLVALLEREFPDRKIAGTSSKDSLRGEKVLAFREKAYDLLVTTTILERGVTVPKSDVLVMGADSPVFDEASLVQMAGRAGRSKEDPAGHVGFASRNWTISQKGAIRQIRSMNRLAEQAGYLLRDAGKGGAGG